MKDETIVALDGLRLRTLLTNARTRNDAEAQRVARVAEDELERWRKRNQRKPRNPGPFRWEKTGNHYVHISDCHKCYVGDRVVAMTIKEANHSSSERDVYHAEIEGRFFRRFEHIDDAKRQMESELRRRGIGQHADGD